MSSLIITSNPVYAQASQADAEITSASAPSPYVDPAMEIEAAFDRFFSTGFGKKLQQRMASGELYVGQAWAEVQVSPQNSQWPKYRVMAYENAITKAENIYLMALSSKIAVEKTRRYFADNSGNIPDFDNSDSNNQDKVSRIFDKALTLTEEKLNMALDDLGVDPEKYTNSSLPQRHTLFKDVLIKSSMKEAVGSLTGLLPIQTFEAQNTNGEHVIGVIIVSSQKMSQFARAIISNRKEFSSDESRRGQSVFELISKDKALLLDQFGIRRLYDEQGYPVLLSYGQWGNAYRGTDKRQSRRQRSAALNQARLQADQQIAMFISGKATATEESQTGQIVEQSIDIHQDNYKEEHDISQIIDQIKKESRSKARVKLSGLTDVLTWSQPHPVYPNQELVGVVRVWSPLYDKNMRHLNDSANKPSETSSQNLNSNINDLRQGKTYMQADDF